MAIITYPAGSSSLILNGTAITDFAEGDLITLTPANPVTAQVNSDNGGVSIFKRMDGDVHDLVFRVQQFSGSDVFMNSATKQDSPVVFNGTLRTTFKRDGLQAAESWALDNGSIMNPPTHTRNNQDGAAVLEYAIRFRSAKRTI